MTVIDRFGAQAVLGRTIGAGEARRMLAVEAIVRAWQEMHRATNVSEWQETNPGLYRVLIDAMEAERHAE